MEAWLIFLLLACLFAAVGFFYRSKHKRDAAQPSVVPKALVPQIVADSGPKRAKPSLPVVWDAQMVSQQLTKFQAQPDIVASYIDALKQRFILRVEDGTAKQRTKFLRTHVEELQLGKEYKMVVHDLNAMEIEQEIRLLRLRLEQQELQAKQQQVTSLGGLQLRKERLAIELEIATLEAKKMTIQNPERPENPLTPEERRAAEKKEVDEKIADLKMQKSEALKIADEEERMRRVNGLDAAIERAYERWSKLV
jgi:hypothetical protein